MTTDDISPKRPTLVRGDRPAGFDRVWPMRGGSGKGKSRGPWVLGSVIALLALLLGILPVAARRGADWLWYRELGFERIFLTKVFAQWTLGVAAGVVALVVLYLNVRLALRALPHEEVPAVDRARGHRCISPVTSRKDRRKHDVGGVDAPIVVAALRDDDGLVLRAE
jgi:uncharacterized membrane protein (UPF0182 family)